MAADWRLFKHRYPPPSNTSAIVGVRELSGYTAHPNRLRRYDDLKGKCGLCEYKKFCGGCRARAFEATGDILAQEPLCSYQPARC